MERRVVITGMGVISSIGNNVNDFWQSLLNCKTGIGYVTHFDTSNYKSKIGAEVKDFNVEKYMSVKDARRMDIFCHYAIAAADEAMAQAGLSKDLSGINSERVGALVSSGIGGFHVIADQHVTLLEKGPDRVSPFFIPMAISDMASGYISIRYGAKGPNYGIVTACASATHSIGEAYWNIRRNDSDIMITGGTEACILPIAYAGFCSMKAMSTRNDDPSTASRPFDLNRDGFIMGEGAGVLVLEELEHAKKRGAVILAEVVGFGASGDAHHITAPAPGGAGAVQAINSAINHAKMNLSQMEYINAHGTSTPLNDKLETEAYKAVFKEHARGINVSSIKGSTGHMLGAAGGVETICCVKTIETGIIPPTINYQTPDPECDLNYTPNKPVERNVEYALNVNLGFGGHNAALILKKFK